MRRNIAILILFLAATSLWAQSENSKGGYNIPAGSAYKVNSIAVGQDVCSSPTEVTLDTAGDLDLSAIPSGTCVSIDTFEDAASDTVATVQGVAGSSYTFVAENDARSVIFSSSAYFVVGGVDQTLDQDGDIARGEIIATDTLRVVEFVDEAGAERRTTFIAGDGSASLPILVASGSSALNTAEIASEGNNVTTISATGVLTSDFIFGSANGTPIGLTGYIPSTDGTLHMWAYLTADNVNFVVVNNTAGAITPGAITVNWMVLRAP